MLMALSRSSLRAAAALAAGLLVAGSLGPARAEEIGDTSGDFLPSYTGPHDPGLDVVAHTVTSSGDRVTFYGRMAGPIAPTQTVGGLYLFGLDRGRGTPRFLAGTPPIGPNVTWDLIVRINPDGTGLVNNQVAGVLTPLDPADIAIDGDEFTASVPLALLTPAATRPPCEWTYNLWPRNGIVPGQNRHVSDLGPDVGNSPVQTVPEVSCMTDLASLWPPNHKMREVAVFVAAADACKDPAELVLSVAVSSDEADDAAGDGDGGTDRDTDGGDGFAVPVDVTSAFAFNPAAGGFEGSVFLRAERAEGGVGRTYTIEAAVLNGDGNGAASRCDVVVPSDRSP